MIEQYKLEKEEVVLRVVRRHWFVMLWEIIGVLSAVTLPLVALVLLEVLQFNTLIEWLTIHSVLFGYSLWVLLVCIQFAFAWTNYYFDMWIVTDRRIIHVEQVAMFSRVLSSFRLERIQDITVDIHGFFHTLLDFGDIHVQTAGAERKFVLYTTPNPNELRDFILDLQSKKRLSRD
ncbi:MAG: PH domain-containing protein [Candidatus Paceibacterota bacterium]